MDLTWLSIKEAELTISDPTIAKARRKFLPLFPQSCIFTVMDQYKLTSDGKRSLLIDDFPHSSRTPAYLWRDRQLDLPFEFGMIYCYDLPFGAAICLRHLQYFLLFFISLLSSSFSLSHSLTFFPGWRSIQVIVLSLPAGSIFVFMISLPPLAYIYC